MAVSMASAARTARSASSSCPTGAPQSANSPSPSSCATVPSKRRTSAAISETISSNRNLERSGPSRSPIAVEPTTSANRTVTMRWVPVVATTATSYSIANPSALDAAERQRAHEMALAQQEHDQQRHRDHDAGRHHGRPLGVVLPLVGQQAELERVVALVA